MTKNSVQTCKLMARPSAHLHQVQVIKYVATHSNVLTTH